MSSENTAKVKFTERPLVKRILASDYITLTGIICLIITFSIVVQIVNSNFLSPTNIINIGRQIVVYGILSCALSFPMINGTFDISISSTAALGGMMTALFITDGLAGLTLPIPIAIIVSILACCVVGLVNGVIISYSSIPPFIVTLGTQTGVRGIVYLISNNKPIGGLPDGFLLLTSTDIGPIPIQIILMLIVFVIVGFVLNRTSFGRKIYANGGNYQAAFQSGIRVARVRTAAHVISAGLAAVAGILLTARVGSAQPTACNTYEGIAISSCAMGGVSLAGGSGMVTGVFFGAVMMGLLTNGMNLMRISSNWQWVVRGVLLIGAVFYSLWITNRANRIKK